MVLFSRGGDVARLPAPGVWPRAKLLAVLKRRYSAVDDLGEDGDFSLYGVTDGEVRFGVILVLADGAPDKVSEVGFLARFSGYSLGASALDAAGLLSARNISCGCMPGGTVSRIAVQSSGPGRG